MCEGGMRGSWPGTRVTMDLHRGGEEFASLQVLRNCPALLSPCKPWAQALTQMAADSSNQMTKILRQTSQNTMACESLLRRGKSEESGVGKSVQHLAGKR